MKFDPIFDEADNKLYTFSYHAIEQLDTMAERQDITWELIEQAVIKPTATQQSPTGAEERMLNVKDKWLKVVLNEEKQIIITAYWFQPSNSP